MIWCVRSSIRPLDPRKQKSILARVFSLDPLAKRKQQLGHGSPANQGWRNRDEAPSSLTQVIAFPLQIFGKFSRLVIATYTQSFWRKNAGFVSIVHAQDY